MKHLEIPLNLIIIIILVFLPFKSNSEEPKEICMPKLEMFNLLNKNRKVLTDTLEENVLLKKIIGTSNRSYALDIINKIKKPKHVGGQ